MRRKHESEKNPQLNNVDRNKKQKVSDSSPIKTVNVNLDTVNNTSYTSKFSISSLISSATTENNNLSNNTNTSYFNTTFSTNNNILNTQNTNQNVPLYNSSNYHFSNLSKMNNNISLNNDSPPYYDKPGYQSNSFINSPLTQNFHFINYYNLPTANNSQQPNYGNINITHDPSLISYNSSNITQPRNSITKNNLNISKVIAPNSTLDSSFMLIDNARDDIPLADFLPLKIYVKPTSLLEAIRGENNKKYVLLKDQLAQAISSSKSEEQITKVENALKNISKLKENLDKYKNSFKNELDRCSPNNYAYFLKLKALSSLLKNNNAETLKKLFVEAIQTKDLESYNQSKLALDLIAYYPSVKSLTLLNLYELLTTDYDIYIDNYKQAQLSKIKKSNYIISSPPLKELVNIQSRISISEEEFKKALIYKTLVHNVDSLEENYTYAHLAIIFSNNKMLQLILNYYEQWGIDTNKWGENIFHWSLHYGNIEVAEHYYNFAQERGLTYIHNKDNILKILEYLKKSTACERGTKEAVEKFILEKYKTPEPEKYSHGQEQKNNYAEIFEKILKIKEENDFIINKIKDIISQEHYGFPDAIKIDPSGQSLPFKINLENFIEFMESRVRYCQEISSITYQMIKNEEVEQLVKKINCDFFHPSQQRLFKITFEEYEIYKNDKMIKQFIEQQEDFLVMEFNWNKQNSNPGTNENIHSDTEEDNATEQDLYIDLNLPPSSNEIEALGEHIAQHNEI